MTLPLTAAAADMTLGRCCFAVGQTHTSLPLLSMNNSGLCVQLSGVEPGNATVHIVFNHETHARDVVNAASSLDEFASSKWISAVEQLVSENCLGEETTARSAEIDGFGEDEIPGKSATDVKSFQSKRPQYATF